MRTIFGLFLGEPKLNPSPTSCFSAAQLNIIYFLLLITQYFHLPYLKSEPYHHWLPWSSPLTLSLYFVLFLMYNLFMEIVNYYYCHVHPRLHHRPCVLTFLPLETTNLLWVFYFIIVSSFFCVIIYVYCWRWTMTAFTFFLPSAPIFYSSTGHYLTFLNLSLMAIQNLFFFFSKSTSRTPN